ncbi:MAG: Trk system potassium transporter TrkA [Candidatus Glassbacteria bacterium]|nr:Trk system potassium transporter TrkA [Candidatus Glassbacteria bacterium]
MRAIIVGAGDVGFHLAGRLFQQGEEICVIDIDQEKVDRVQDHLDVLAFQGSGVDYNLLTRAGVGDTDTLIAVTDNDEVNIMTCQLSSRYGVDLKIARVGGEYYYGENPLAPFGELGIDVMVNPEEACALEVERLLRRAAASDVVEFDKGAVVLMGIKITERCLYRDMPLKRIAGEFERRQFLVAAINRGEQTIIPHGDDVIIQDDLLYVIGKSEATGEIFRLTGHEDRRLERVMVAGGNKVGILLARRLEAEGVSPVIFEADRNRCAYLAEELSSTLVLNGDATDLDLLAAEGVDGVGGFVALTEDDEANIISCLVAKNMGAGKTISQIKRLEYLSLASRIGIDAVVSPHLSTVNAILAATTRKGILSLVTLRGLSVQIMEVIIRPDFPGVGKPLRELSLPGPCILGSVARGTGIFIPHGDDRLESGDKVIIFTLAKHVRKVGKYFL